MTKSKTKVPKKKSNGIKPVVKSSKKFRLKNQYRRAIIYSFRLPFSDGSFTFFKLQKNGLYKSEQGVEHTFQELMKYVGYEV